jgi:hypothetical protein
VSKTYRIVTNVYPRAPGALLHSGTTARNLPADTEFPDADEAAEAAALERAGAGVSGVVVLSARYSTGTAPFSVCGVYPFGEQPAGELPPVRAW